MADETQLALDDFLKNRALGNVPKVDDEYSDDDLRFVPQQNDPLADTFRGIVRGPVEAMKNATVNISDMLGIEGTEEEISPFFTGVLNKIDEPETTLGKSLESVSSFVSSYALLRGFGAKTFTSAAITGAAVDMTIWDKEDGRLADILDDAGVQSVVIDYMKTDKDDTAFENGLKNAIEGVALGTITEGVIKGIAQGYKLTKAKLQTTGETLDETVAVQPSTLKEVETPSDLTEFVVNPKQESEVGSSYIDRVFKENNVSPEDEKYFYNNISRNFNSLTEALPKFKKWMDNKPFRTPIDYEKGPVQFHGTSSPISELKGKEETYTYTNIYGDGFYTTNKAEIADTYTKKGKGETPTVYSVTEKTPVKNLNLEETKAVDNDVIDFNAFDIEVTPNMSLREAIDKLRESSRDYDFMEVMDDLQNEFSKQGYGSWSHLGGEQTAGKGHYVQIYFDPKTQLDIQKLTPEQIKENTKAFESKKQNVQNIKNDNVLKTDIPLVKPQASTELIGTKPPETGFNYGRVEGLDDEAKAVLEGVVNNKDLSDFLSTGVRPQAITEQMVQTLDKKIGGDYLQFADDLIKDTKDYDVKLVYMKQKMYDKLIEVQDLTKNIDTADTAGMVTLLNKWNELTILTGAAKAAQTGAARATAAGRISLVPKEVMDSVTELAQNEPGLLSREIEKYLDKATLTKIKKQIFEATDIENDVTLHKAMVALNKQDGLLTKIFSALVEMRSAGLLSSPVTQGINITGNLLVRGLARVEDYAAYGIGKTLNTKDRMMWNELQAMSNGRLTSAMETFSSIGNAIRKGGGVKNIEDNLENNYLDFYQKYDTASAKSISSDYLMNLSKESGTIAKGIGATIDVVGAGIRLPFHALGITDDMFKRSIYTGQISYIGTREANNLKLVGEAKDKYISEFITTHKLVFSKRAKDLSPEQQELVNKYIIKNDGKYHKEALETSRELTFQEEIRSGKSASRINNMLSKIDEIRNIHPIFNFVVPFYVTPVNLLKWVGRRTPLIHKLSRRMTDDIKAGGRRKNLAYARLAMGSSLYATGGLLAASGVLIGGSSTEEERKSRAQAGISDYSIKIGDKTLEVNRFDPLVTPLMLSADLYTFHREMVDRGYANDEIYTEKFDEVMAALITSFTGNVLNKTWLKSVSDIFDAIKYGNENYAKQAIASFAPYSSAFRYANQQESYKEASTLLENFTKIYRPSLLKDKLDVFGKAYKDERFAGIKESTITDSPVRKEIARLKIPITKFDKKIVHKSAELELEPEDHWKMQSYVNTVFKLEDRLNKIISSGGYQRLPEGIDFTQIGTKKYMIQKAISETRSKARNYFLSKNKARVDELYKDYQEKVDSVNNKRSQLQEWLNKDK